MIPLVVDRLTYTKQLDSLLRKHNIKRVIDVGANIGQFGREIRSLYSGELFSLEPYSKAFKKLLAHSSPDPNWHPIQTAAGSVKGRRELNVSVNHVFNSFYKAAPWGVSYFGKTSAPASVEEVEVCPLDEIFTDKNTATFLKLDTQGFELEVIEGAKGILGCCELVQTELCTTRLYPEGCLSDELEARLEALGYKIYCSTVVNKLDGEIMELDGLFIKQSSR